MLLCLRVWKIVLAIVITLVIVATLLGNLQLPTELKYMKRIGSAEEKAREIIDEALKTAETKKREALLEAKEEALRAKNEFERETKERRSEIQRYEKGFLLKKRL